MEREDNNISAALESFMRQLPDPGKTNNISTISTWIEINGQKIKLLAQKAKSSLGIKWEIHQIGSASR